SIAEAASGKVKRTSRKYRCNQCKEIFSWFGDLNHHLKIIHNVVKKRGNNKSVKNNTFKCSSCKYEAKYQSELKRHMRLHSKTKPFVCKFCPYCSSWKGDLKRHMESHHKSCFSADFELNNYMAQFKNNAGTYDEQQSMDTSCSSCDENLSATDWLLLEKHQRQLSTNAINLPFLVNISRMYHYINEQKQKLQDQATSFSTSLMFSSSQSSTSAPQANSFNENVPPNALATSHLKTLLQGYLRIQQHNQQTALVPPLGLNNISLTQPISYPFGYFDTLSQ
ncbi:hypothetical protein Ciccas_013556, partial [Cichlidogyrus casuarinus]